MEKPLVHTQTKAPNTKYNSCTDIDGTVHPHGEFYTPVGSPCSQCPCDNGHPEVCIMLRCDKPHPQPNPQCEEFKRVPGKCCDYKCINEIDFTDKTTLAIVISLSIVLVFTLIAIILVVKKIRRKKRYGERLSSVSLNSQNQPPEETDLDDIIQRNSIPNNLRHHHQPPVQTSTSSNNVQQNVNKIVAEHLEKTYVKNDLRKFDSELSCNSLDGDDTDPSSQSDDGSSNKVKVKRFEQTLQYTPLSATSI